MTTALVVGLLPRQVHAVRQAVGRKLRLRFVPSDSVKGLKATSTINVLMVDYLNHGAEARVRKLIQPGQTIHVVRGLEKNAIELLERLP